MRTPNDSAVRCIRYWLKLTRMEAPKLPSKAYRMLHVLDARGKETGSLQVVST